MLAKQELQITYSRQANYLYYMCLLDWGGTILDEAKHKAVAQSILPDGKHSNGWCVAWKEARQSEVHGVKPRFLLGFYHSRLIFRFALQGSPKTISELREIRLAMGDFIEIYLKESVFPQVWETLRIYLKAFIYPVFELNARCRLWEFTRTRPYSLPTTCFYTELADPEQPRWRLLRARYLRELAKAFFRATVKMRISGAKLITSPMSEWFFFNLTNLIYHEGLYRHSREKQLADGEVYKGLETRLEDFADRLMASFSQSVARVQQRTFSWLLVLLTIVLIALTVSVIVVSICN